MKSPLKKILLLSCMFFSGMPLRLTAQDTAAFSNKPERYKWFIVLPLRFTHLQNNNTMLSGIKAGRVINEKFSASLSVYHSFYLSSFKSKANLDGFETQPRLFINCAGLELQYDVYKRKAFGANVQVLAGWGFLKYDLKEHGFKSRQVNYLALEPSVNTEFFVGKATVISLGIGYRPVFGQGTIAYTSAVSEGNIPVNRQLVNGLNILLCLKGYL